MTREEIDLNEDHKKEVVDLKEENIDVVSLDDVLETDEVDLNEDYKKEISLNEKAEKELNQESFTNNSKDNIIFRAVEMSSKGIGRFITVILMLIFNLYVLLPYALLIYLIGDKNYTDITHDEIKLIQKKSYINIAISLVLFLLGYLLIFIFYILFFGSFYFLL